MWKKIVSALLIFSVFSFSIFSADNNTPEKYDTSELPQSLKDLRRFEIITLGSLPFVMMDTTLVYSSIMTISGAENAKGNPYNVTLFASDSCFTWEQDQAKIIGISLGICLGIGITDLVIHLIKRSSAKKKILRTATRDIIITPVSEDPDATFIKPPETYVDNEQDIEDDSVIDLFTNDETELESAIDRTIIEDFDTEFADSNGE